MLTYNPDLLYKGNLPAAFIPILEMLLEKGANPNLTNWIGVTPSILWLNRVIQRERKS